MPVRIIPLQKRAIKKRTLQRIVIETFKEAGIKGKEVNIVLANDSLLRELNLRYRGVDSPTDVLSFPYREKDLWGEVIVSLDTCERQAQEKGHSFDKELATLIVHGVLHLLGWNDENEEEWKRMVEMQDRIINRIGEL